MAVSVYTNSEWLERRCRMRIFEECPYITPCKWCSRQNKPCEIEEKKPRKCIGAGVDRNERTGSNKTHVE